MSKQSIIRAKIEIALRSYPTQGIGMDDLMIYVRELCGDDGIRISLAESRRAIKAFKPTQKQGRYFPALPESGTATK